MNIFATHESPVISALWLDDKRLNKMILESAQMLSTVLRRYGIGNGIHYKSAYQNHPCTLWAGKTRDNFEWLCDHALAMCTIYTTMTKKIHACEKVIFFCFKQGLSVVPKGKRTPFADCTEFKHRTDISVCERYKLFMILKWTTRDSKKPTFTKRRKPDWFNEYEIEKAIKKEPLK